MFRSVTDMVDLLGSFQGLHSVQVVRLKTSSHLSAFIILRADVIDTDLAKHEPT